MIEIFVSMKNYLLNHVHRCTYTGGASDKNPSAHAGDNPWVGKIPWRRAWQPTPVFLSRESPWREEPGKLQSMSCKELDTTWVWVGSGSW